jgi:hypothetical protein
VYGQTIQPPYSNSYTFINLGVLEPSIYAGGLAYLDEGSLLFDRGAEFGQYGIYAIPVTRDGNGHVTAFGTPTPYASMQYSDGGLAFGPGGILFATGWPTNTLYEYKPGSTSADLTLDLTPLGVASSVGTLQFVPRGYPDANGFKIISLAGGQWYDATLTPNSSGTYDVSNVVATVSTAYGTEGVFYVPPGSPQFNVPTVLVSNAEYFYIYAYALDSDGNASGSPSAFMTGLTYPYGGTFDPISGDLLVDEAYRAGVIEIRGFPGSSLAVSSGATQSAIVNQAFASPLTVLASDSYGAPLAGVTVSFSAPASGASATLSSASVVTGPDGTATVTAASNATAGSYTVTASMYGRSTSFSLTNVALSSLTLSPVATIGGHSTTGNTVALTAPAPAGGASILLSSSKPVATVPTSVTVTGGSAVSEHFTITTTAVAAATHVSIRASDGIDTKAATLTVNPASIAAVNLSPKSVVGGKSTTNNTITLNGPAPAAGAVVSLASNTTVAAVPPSVTIAAGASSSPAFTITTTAVATQTPVTISAAYGVTKTSTLTVNPPQLAALKLSPSSVKGGRSTTNNIVVLNGPAPTGGAIVMLTSGNTDVVSVPASVTVAAGATSALFTIKTTKVTTNTVVSITATYGGSTKMANLTVTP